MTNSRGRTSRECKAQGVGNLLGGLLGGMGGCALIGQSLVNVNTGGTTRVAGVTVALSMVAVLVSPQACAFLGTLPVAALVGLMLSVAGHTFAWSSVRMLPKVPFADALVVVAVALVTLWKNLAVAVAVGVLASALRFAWQASCDLRVVTAYDVDSTSLGHALRSAIVSSAFPYQPDSPPPLGQGGAGGGGKGVWLAAAETAEAALPMVNDGSGWQPKAGEDCTSSYRASRVLRIEGPLFFGSTTAFKRGCSPSPGDMEYATDAKAEGEARAAVGWYYLREPGAAQPSGGKEAAPNSTSSSNNKKKDGSSRPLRHVVIDFMGSRVWDHSAIEAIDELARKYHEAGVTLHLRHLSPDCRALLSQASAVHLAPSTVVETDAAMDPAYQVAADYGDVTNMGPTLRIV